MDSVTNMEKPEPPEQPAKVRMRARGLIDPAFAAQIQSRTIEGIARRSGQVVLEGELDQTLMITEENDLGDDEPVVVGRDNAGLYCIPTDEYEVYQERLSQFKEDIRAWKDAQAKQSEREREQQLEAFWNNYDIPFEHATAIKGRRSGLLRGSSGDGRDARTVDHLWVREAFEDGRLSREADVYLCSPNDAPSFSWTDERDFDEDDGYRSTVTCESCLALMERWETDE